MARYRLDIPTGLQEEAERFATQRGISLDQLILWAVTEKIGETGQRLRIPAPSFPGIEYRFGAAGWPTPVLRGTGLRVQTVVVAATTWGMSISEIAEDYELSTDQVQEALTFYEAHRQEIEASLTSEQAHAEAAGAA